MSKTMKNDPIQNLKDAIAEAQRALEVMQAPPVTREGWANTRASGMPWARPENHPDGLPSRHGCEWNDKETRDLAAGWLHFTAVETLAGAHHRSVHSVRSQLQRLLNSANIKVLLDEICGEAA